MSTVLRLITRLNVGGPSRQALLLTRELAADYPTVLGAGTPEASEGEMSDPAVTVEHVPLKRAVSPRADVASLVRVTRLVRRIRPALLHTHLAKAGSMGRLASLTIRPRPKVVHTYHGHVLDGYFSPTAQRVFIETERMLARATDVIIAISPEIRDDLLSIGIGRPEQYRVIPLGLDLDSFLEVEGPSGLLRTQLGLDDRTPLVGAFGRLVAIKHLTMLIDAVAQLDGVHLALIGDGEDRLALEQHARDSPAAGRVHFTGWAPDVAAYVSDLDIVALTSRNEGTPVALIEALAAAKPVVATDVGGVRFVVKPDETGLLAPTEDAETFARLLRTALDQPDRMRGLALAGRAHVEASFSSHRLVADIRSLYAELIAPD
jgi:glycosyltransferase involved in cell wall biosynthesis